jgi:hypothetical protein
VLAIQETAQLERRILPLSVFTKQATRSRPATDQKACPLWWCRGHGKRQCPLQAASLQRSQWSLRGCLGAETRPCARICVASTYWRQPRSYDGRPPAFPVEALIDSYRSNMVKTPYVMIAGDFNVHVLTNELGNDYSANHNAPGNNPRERCDEKCWLHSILHPTQAFSN